MSKSYKSKVKKAPLRIRQRLDIVFGLVAAKSICSNEAKKEVFNKVIQEELEALGLFYDFKNLSKDTQKAHFVEFRRLNHKVDQLAKELEEEGK